MLQVAINIAFLIVIVALIGLGILYIRRWSRSLPHRRHGGGGDTAGAFIPFDSDRDGGNDSGGGGGDGGGI